jgi:hypothetical protein
MIFTLTAALLAVQSQATPVTVGACAAARTTAADRQNVSTNVQAGRAPDQPTFDRLRASIRGCSSGTPHASSIPSAVAQVAQAEMRRDLTQRGVDTGIVDRWYAGQSDAIKTDSNVLQQQAEMVVRGLIDGGLPEAQLNPNAQLIGSYIGTLIVVERIRRGMSPTP